jgi:ABC-2 type transport system ATP-binding protein
VSAAIRTMGLTRRFAGAAVVDRLDLSIEAGEIFGLVGPDGAGKTTTLRMLAGILEPSAGDAWVAGRHTRREAEALKEDTGYMSQRFGLYPDLTVWENLRFYADIYGVPRRERQESMERLLAFGKLTVFRDRPAGHLSGGMKQKLGLACALIHTPKVLLLDEPTNGVDPVSRRDFWDILYQLLRQQVTILVTTCYLDEAERCNRVALMHKGRLTALGTPEEIRGRLHGEVLEIGTGAVREAAAVLREAEPGCAVTLYGDRLHVATAPRSGDRLAAVLAGRGIVVDSLRQVEPSLEDVFVALLGQNQEAGHGPDS